jgi:hypothetical protein
MSLARWLAGSLLGLLVVAAIVLFQRRLAGAFTEEPSPLVLSVAGLTIAALVGMLGVLCGHRPGLWMKRGGRFLRWLPLVAAAGVAAAISFPRHPVALVGLWLPLVAEEGLAAWLRRRLNLSRPGRPALFEPSTTAMADLPEPSVTQELVRRRSSDGREYVTGRLHVCLEAHQRTATAHLAFCPPFVRTPDWNVEQTEGPHLRIRTVQLLPYGVRIDLKRSEPCDQPAAIWLSFSAQSQ